MGKAERTRQFIIEQIAPIFNKKGFAGTSIADLTEATGLTKGAIYGNFENKDEVALAAFQYNIEQVYRGLGKALEAKSSPLEKLKAFPEYYRLICREGFMEVGCPIANTAPEADDTHPALRKAVNEAIENWDNTIQRLVQKGIKQGEIQPSTSPSSIASLMMSLIEGGVLLSKSTGNTTYIFRSLDQVEHLLDSIKT